MSMDGIFSSRIRSAGDLAGVFEITDNTGYFYLFKTTESQGKKVVGSIRILSKTPDFNEQDIVVRWDKTENKVGLWIRGKLWAAFDADTRAPYGGNYDTSNHSDIPSHIIACFKD